MDRALKERLIGAVVLIGIGVWLIPWVLDGPSRSEDEPTVLELPVADEPLPLRTRTIHLDDRDAVLEAATPARPSAATREEDARPTEPPATSGTADAAEGDRAAPPGVRDAGVRDAAEAEVAAAPRVADAAEADHAATPQIAGAAEADLAAAPERAPAVSRPAEEETRIAAVTAARGDWAVQLGSFSQEDNARRLAERVAGHGHRPNVTDVRTGGRLMHRVRVGPYASRQQAADVAAELSALGFVAQVVNAD